MEHAVAVLDSIIARFNSPHTTPNFSTAITDLNDSSNLSFQQYVHAKQVEMDEKTNTTPSLSQFGIDMKSFDWNNWTFIRENVYPKVLSFYITDFTDYLGTISHQNTIFLNEIIPRTKHMLQTTCVGGKLLRGLLHILSFKLLRESKQKRNFCENDAHNALIMCLIIEALQSYFLVMDDIMDQSLTRRGVPCWYKHANVALKAVNDGPVIESLIFWLIHHRLVADQCIVDRLDRLIRKTIIQTQFGQMIDLELTSDAKDLKTMYTLKRYETIAKFKTSYYTFYCPYAAALYLAGYNDDANEQELLLFYICEQLSLRLGINFQIVDDYLDVYGDYKVMGKIGTDIEDFKCSWLLVQAIRLCNDKQYQILHDNYGGNDDKSIQRIKDLYNQLDLSKVYHEWEQKAHSDAMCLVESVGDALPKHMFTVIMKKLYKRNK
eukprot:145186_1